MTLGDPSAANRLPVDARHGQRIVFRRARNPGAGDDDFLDAAGIILDAGLLACDGDGPEDRQQPD